MESNTLDNIKIALVKEVREKTGNGLFFCKRSLVQNDWNVEAAIKQLIEEAAREHRPTYVLDPNRPTQIGLVATYVHFDKIGAMVELGTETDFCARSETIKQFAHQLCVHICACAPNCVSQLEFGGKPEHAVALFTQPWVYDESRTVVDVLHEMSARTGENIGVKRIVRFSL